MGRDIWITGKGPSLDRYDWTQAGYPRLAVNEAALLVEGCAAVCKDTRMVRIYERILPTQIPVYTKNFSTLRRLRNHRQFPMGPVLCRYPYVNSISMCCIIGRHFGYNRLHIIGCDMIDGIPGYAECAKQVAVSHFRQDNYQHMNMLMLNLLSNLDVEIIWEHRNV